ncbi:MAG: hypothetical protein ACQKBW_12840, partial [Puniceicoccales bacterium]
MLHLPIMLGALLVVVGVVQALDCYVPMNFADPLWEYGLFGDLVSCLWLPLIGLGLILIPVSLVCPFWQLKLRGILGWLALAAGIVALLLVPYGMFSTVRVQSALAPAPQGLEIQPNPSPSLSAEVVRSRQFPKLTQVDNEAENLRLLKIRLWSHSISNALQALLASACFLL